MNFFKPIYTRDCKATILFRGKKYIVNFQLKCDASYIPNGVDIIEFTRVDKTAELTISCDYLATFESRFYVKWGGSPRFIQSEYYPINSDGMIYDFLCTVENCWGDGGNCNIFIDTTIGEDNTLVINDIFVESSCY
jgi:hypothetical protein